MSKVQKITILAFIGLFLLLYFAFDITPKTQELVEKSRAESIEKIDINALIERSKNDLNKGDQAEVSALEFDVQSQEIDSVKISVLEKLSGKWYRLKNPIIAGYYAEQIAEIGNSAEQWSISGTTFAIALQQDFDENAKAYCLDHAVKAFENASSLEPENINHQVNLASCYAENPPQDNPMKGIQMLLGLDKKHPESIPVLYQLAKFGMQTGQYDKAIGRLETILKKDQKNKKANCLIFKAFEETGKAEKALEYKQRCENL